MADIGTGMDEDALAAASDWVVRAGLRGMPEPDLLRGFCKRLHAAGVPIARALVIIDTLHPVHEGHVFRWRSDQAAESEVREYGRTDQGGEAAESWRRSPFYGMLQSGALRLRKHLAVEPGDEYPVFAELRTEGQTDYVALIQRFAEDATIGEMDSVHSSWTTDGPGGFDAAQVAALERLVPELALAMKSAALAGILDTLVTTYLGRDAGRRVLGGRITRGVAERIEAVLWFSDLRGFTSIADSSPPDTIIPFLNDYAEAIIPAIEEAGGDVLKLVGDGILAIFNADEIASACGCALAAQRSARARLAALNTRRGEAGLPVTAAYLGLHVGEVFFGNIGSQKRLDFTVVGPAVNEVSRIVAMCRSVERNVLVSAAFLEAARPEDRARLVSVGRYALRGVARPQELFTLDPGEA